jgi:hypothetical protein
MSQRCSARNRRGKRCGAWAMTGATKCALHSDPERASEMGSKHKRRSTLRSRPSTVDLADRSLKSFGEVSELLEETINLVRQGPFDLRAANAIGFLAGILLKALDQRLEARVAHLEAVMAIKEGTDAEAFEFRSEEEATQ